MQCIRTIDCHAASLLGGSRQWKSCHALPQCLRAVGSGTPAMHCVTAWGHWAVEIPQYAASLLGGSGHCHSCNTLLHCLIVWGRGAVELLQHTSLLPKGIRQWNPCNAMCRCLGAVGKRPPATHRLIARV